MVGIEELVSEVGDSKLHEAEFLLAASPTSTCKRSTFAPQRSAQRYKLAVLRAGFAHHVGTVLCTAAKMVNQFARRRRKKKKKENKEKRKKKQKKKGGSQGCTAILRYI